MNKDLKELTTAIIVDDIVRTRFVTINRRLGVETDQLLTCSSPYIFPLLGIKGEIPESVWNKYKDMIETGVFVPRTDQNMFEFDRKLAAKTLRVLEKEAAKLIGFL